MVVGLKTYMELEHKFLSEIEISYLEMESCHIISMASLEVYKLILMRQKRQRQVQEPQLKSDGASEDHTVQTISLARCIM